MNELAKQAIAKLDELHTEPMDYEGYLLIKETIEDLATEIEVLNRNIARMSGKGQADARGEEYHGGREIQSSGARNDTVIQDWQ